jgi:hypothetical protein
MILSPHELGWLALNVGGWTGDDAAIAVAVALAESGGDTDVLARSKDPASASLGQRDHGLWQISGRWHGKRLQVHRWRDPFDNCRMARQVFDEFVRSGKPGWSAWAVFNGGAFEAFMPDARHGLAAPFIPVNPHTTGWRA